VPLRNFGLSFSRRGARPHADVTWLVFLVVAAVVVLVLIALARAQPAPTQDPDNRAAHKRLASPQRPSPDTTRDNGAVTPLPADDGVRCDGLTQLAPALRRRQDGEPLICAVASLLPPSRGAFFMPREATGAYDEL
jgi:hypothetical protein